MTILPEHVPRRVHPSQLVAGSLLAIGGTAVVGLTLVGAESFARLREADYLIKRRGLHVFSETYGWRGRPGASLVLEGKRVTLNGGGYRGRELALPRARGRTRVVVLGDSIAFGLHVADEETFTHLLEVRDSGMEAGNLAVQGYGPDQELLAEVAQ